MSEKERKTMAARKPDVRAERSHRALTEAFSSLILERRRYDQITIGALIERAGISRSTFYEHFKNKDEVLAASMEYPFSLLAGCATNEMACNGLPGLLEHFWSHRDQARAIFGGVARRVMSRALARTIAELLARSKGADDPVQVRLISRALAEAQLGSLFAWFNGDISCSPAQIAEMLTRISRLWIVPVTFSRRID